MKQFVTPFAALGLLVAIWPAAASNISFQGNFSSDDEVQLFDLTLNSPATVDIRSSGYAGGVLSTGSSVPRGGFDTVLTIFDSNGQFIAFNDDGAGVSTDPVTGIAGDARLTESLPVGNYIAALTQYDNFPAGFNLVDGFIESGFPTFTNDLGFAPGPGCPGKFRDISGNCRTSNWALDFLNVDSATETPEPDTWISFPFGIAGLFAFYTLCVHNSRRVR